MLSRSVAAVLCLACAVALVLGHARGADAQELAGAGANTNIRNGQENDLCGYRQLATVTRCSSKQLCDRDCQRASCRALVGFHQATDFSIQYSDKDLEEPNSRWLTSPEDCDGIDHLAYCHWAGVSCCCYKQVGILSFKRRLALGTVTYAALQRHQTNLSSSTAHACTIAQPLLPVAAAGPARDRPLRVVPDRQQH